MVCSLISVSVMSTSRLSASTSSVKSRGGAIKGATICMLSGDSSSNRRLLRSNHLCLADKMAGHAHLSKHEILFRLRHLPCNPPMHRRDHELLL